MLKPENIPDELKTLPRWVCYRLPDKTPLNPAHRRKCGKHAVGHLSRLRNSSRGGDTPRLHGHRVRAGGGIVGIDVDHCIDGLSRQS